VYANTSTSQGCEVIHRLRFAVQAGQRQRKARRTWSICSPGCICHLPPGQIVSQKVAVLGVDSTR
jgi:hypothetical protein